MSSDEHVGPGTSNAGLGGLSPEDDIRFLPPESKSSRSKNRKNLKLESEEEAPVLEARAASISSKPRYNMFSYVWIFSIWLCLSVLALSIVVQYAHDKHPLFVELQRRQFDHYLSALREKFVGQRGQSYQTGAFRYSLLWMAPFLSGGGYCSEALSYLAALEASKAVMKLKIGHYADYDNIKFWKGLSSATQRTLLLHLLQDINLANSVVICHSEPGAWYPPLYQTAPCPPTGYEEPLYIVGRTMFETDSVSPHHVERCNRMDEVWVPTQFHMDSFIKAGVESKKLVKLVQAVDTHFFDPVKVKPFRLPTTDFIFESDCDVTHSGTPFVFLSMFKWEHRKGWDVLLSAYLQEFSAVDNVILYLLTNPYHSTNDFAGVMREFVHSAEIQEPESGWPKVHVIDEHIPQAQLPGLYKAADCFVLSSRGEGWGRPLVEAMAMELPVISTNWSGMTEYLTELNSYPLQLDGMSEVPEGPFQGHFWAEPSIRHLMLLMRMVVINPKEAKKKGKVAREDMVAKYSSEVLGRLVLNQLLRIQDKLDSRRSMDAFQD